MPLDLACMASQEFSCGFKSHPIGEYAIGLSKSNQSLPSFSNSTAFCSKFAQIKTWEKPPIKTLFKWSGGPRSSGVSFFCFVSLRAWKQKKPTPLDRGPPLHVNRPLVTLLNQSVFSHGMQSCFCPLKLGWAGCSLTCYILKLQFRLWREAQKVTQFYEFLVEIMAQNTNIKLIYNSLRPWRRLQECEVKKPIWERQKAKPVNSEFIF